MNTSLIQILAKIYATINSTLTNSVKKAGPRRALLFGLCISGVLLSLSCKESTHLKPGTHFVPPLDFTQQGFLDLDTYQVVGLKIGEIKQNIVNKKQTNAQAERSKKKALYRGRQYSLFFARLNAYKVLTGKPIFKNDEAAIYIPEKVRVDGFFAHYSPLIPPLSARLKRFLLGYNIREEIVTMSQLEDLVWRTVIHLHEPNLYEIHHQLPRGLVPVRDPAMSWWHQVLKSK